MRLEDVEIGKKVYICKIENTGSIRRRLLDLGIMEQACIQPVLSSPSKLMRAYRLNGTLIALRSDDSKWIQVEERG